MTHDPITRRRNRTLVVSVVAVGLLTSALVAGMLILMGGLAPRLP